MTTEEQRVMETRIDAELFGRRYWASPRWREATRSKLIASAHATGDEPGYAVEITPAVAATCGTIWNHNEYCTDWSLIPSLIAECVKRKWLFRTYHETMMVEPWVVGLRIGYKTIRGLGTSLPMALSRAIVAVLDATAETEKASDA